MATPIIDRITSDPEWLLAQLEIAYRADRAAVDRAYPRHNLPNRCRYCLAAWQRFNGTQHEGHVHCIVSRRFIDQVTELIDSTPGISYQRVADRLGVNAPVVRAWWNVGKGNVQR